MNNKILKTITTHNMIFPGEEVAVALSGGADSVCLLLCLIDLARELKFSVSAVHINHCLRGKESDFDQDFCENLCENLKIPLKIFKIDVKSRAKGRNLEQTARQVRYECFDTVRVDKIATAHTLNDVAETLIFNITRGCGGKGLASIPPVRGRIIRPLIDISRSEIESYLSAQNQSFVTDSTNADVALTRNKIRHQIIPILCEINPAFLGSVKRLCENMRENNDYISSALGKLSKSNLSASELKKHHKSLVCDYIAMKCKDSLDISLDKSQIDQCYKALHSGGKAGLKKGCFFYVENDKICFGIPQNPEKPDFCLPVDLTAVEGVPLIVASPYNSYGFRLLQKNDTNIHKLLLNNSMDYDMIVSGALFLRNRRCGDELRPRGRNCTKKLKTIFNEAKIPVEKRDALAVLATSADLIWAEGVGVNERFAISEKTKTIITILPQDMCEKE